MLKNANGFSEEIAEKYMQNRLITFVSVKVQSTHEYAHESKNINLFPLLLNIFLHELDVFIDKLMKHIEKNIQETNIQEHILSDLNNVKINYVRFADTFLVGVIGSKKITIHIKEQISFCLFESLGLSLNDSNFVITKASKESVYF
jgi:hypothetical protein